jgi:hypothetical protein
VSTRDQRNCSPEREGGVVDYTEHFCSKRVQLPPRLPDFQARALSAVSHQCAANTSQQLVSLPCLPFHPSKCLPQRGGRTKELAIGSETAVFLAGVELG